MKNDENEREIAEEKILLEPEEESIVRVITGNIVRTLLEDSNMQQDRIQNFGKNQKGQKSGQKVFKICIPRFSS